MQEGSRVALVHDFLVDVRGAERVFLALCDLFPEADLFTAVYDEEGTEGRFAHRTLHTSFLQRLRPNARTFRALLPMYPAAMESLDLRGYDLVISSSSAWAHGVIPDEDAVHVCYCHNPFRYAWNARQETLRGPRAARARGAGGRLPALAPVGLDRRAARRRLRGQLADDKAARGALLRPRGDRPAPARRHRALHAPASRARRTSCSPS